MTIFVSTAIFDGGDGSTYFQPRREAVTDLTQARKAASRFWAGRVRNSNGELQKIVMLEVAGLTARVHERTSETWVAFDPPREIPGYIQALIDQAGGIPDQPEEMPDTLEINGSIYKRQI